MLDQPRDPGDDDEPIWDPSGWTPVFAGAPPGRPAARLIGHTRLTIPADQIQRLRLTSPLPNDDTGAFSLHGDIALYPLRQGGALIWAWHLEDEADRPHVPKFRPLAN